MRDSPSVKDYTKDAKFRIIDIIRKYGDKMDAREVHALKDVVRLIEHCLGEWQSGLIDVAQSKIESEVKRLVSLELSEHMRMFRQD